jgi:hypothetical protein
VPTTWYWARRNPVWAIVIVTLALGTALWIAELFSALRGIERSLQQQHQKQYQQH